MARTPVRNAFRLFILNSDRLSHCLGSQTWLYTCKIRSKVGQSKEGTPSMAEGSLCHSQRASDGFFVFALGFGDSLAT